MSGTCASPKHKPILGILPQILIKTKTIVYVAELGSIALLSDRVKISKNIRFLNT